MLNNINNNAYKPYLVTPLSKNMLINKPVPVVFRGQLKSSDIANDPFKICREVTAKFREVMGWPKSEDACKRLHDEVVELKQGIKNKDSKNIEEEIGDIIFVLSDIAQMEGTSIEKSLNNANEKVLKRLNLMQQISSKPLADNTPVENALLWKKAKAMIKS